MTRKSFIILALLCGALALYSAFGLPQSLRAAAWLSGSLGWSVLSLLTWVGACVCLLLQWRTDSVPTNRTRALDLLVAVALTCVLVLAIPGRALIEHDESNMLATALRITHDFSPISAIHGVYLRDGGLLVLAEAIDKRGVMFPLLLALLNWSLGYSPTNAMVVNVGCCALALFMVARLSRWFLPSQLAVLVPVLLISFPAFSLTARGGTFDLANLVVVLVLVHQTRRFVVHPTTGLAVCLALSGTVASQLRYESVLLAGLAILLVQLRVAFDPNRRLRRWALPLLPLLLVPSTWRMALPFDWEMPGPWFVPWAWRNAPDNLERLAAWLISPQGMDSGNPIVGALALLALCAAIIRIRRAYRPMTTDHTLWIPIGALLSLITVLMFSYWGQATMLTTSRYFIPVAMATCILALHGMKRMLESLPYGLNHTLAVAIVLTISSLQLPRMRQARAYTDMYLPQYRDRLLATLDRYYGPCNALVLSPHAVPLLTRGRSAMTLVAFEQLGQARLQELSAKALDVVVLAEPLRNGGPLLPAASLPPWVAHARTIESSGPGTGVRLVQLWPEHEVTAKACRKSRQLDHFVVDPRFIPSRIWEQPDQEGTTPP